MKRVTILLLLCVTVLCTSSFGQFMRGIYLGSIDATHCPTAFFDTLAQALKINMVQVQTDMDSTKLQVFLENLAGIGVLHACGRDIQQYSGAQRMIYEAEQDPDPRNLSNWFSYRHPDGFPESPGLRLRYPASAGWFVSDPIPDNEYHYDIDSYRAAFRMKVVGNALPGALVARCVVYCDEHDIERASRQLTWGEFTPNQYSDFYLHFDLCSASEERAGFAPMRIPTGGVQMLTQSTDCRVNIKVYWDGNVETHLDKVTVEDAAAETLYSGSKDAAIRAQAASASNHARHKRFYQYDEPQMSSFLPYRRVSDLIRDELDFIPEANSTTAMYKNFVRFVYDADPEDLMVDPYFIWSQIPHPSIQDNGTADAFGIAHWNYATYLSLLQDSLDAALATWIRPAAWTADSTGRSLKYIPQLHGTVYESDKKYHVNSHRPPAPSEIRLSYYLGIAYGAKGFLPFVYHTHLWEPVDEEHLAFPGLVSNTPVGGMLVNHSSDSATVFTRTLWTGHKEKWAEVGRLNTYLAQIGDTLLALDWRGAKSYSDQQTTCGSWTNLVTEVSTRNTSGIVDATPYVEVGHLKRGATDYLVVVNRRCAPEDTRDIAVTVSLPGAPKVIIARIDSVRYWDVADGRSFTDRFLPGQGKIYRLEPSALRSTSSTATAQNSQRKMIRDAAGRYHMVYESGGEIWYTRSIDGGTTWSPEKEVSTDAIDEEYGPSNCSPSLALQETPNLLLISWELHTPDNQYVYPFVRSVYPASGNLGPLEYPIAQEFSHADSAMPVISCGKTGAGTWYGLLTWYDATLPGLKAVRRTDSTHYSSQVTLRSGTIGELTTAPITVGPNWHIGWTQGDTLYAMLMTLGSTPAPGAITAVAYGQDYLHNLNPSMSALYVAPNDGMGLAWEEYNDELAKRIIKYRERSKDGWKSTIYSWVKPPPGSSNYRTPTTMSHHNSNNVAIAWLSYPSQLKYVKRTSSNWSVQLDLANGFDPAGSVSWPNSPQNHLVAYRSSAPPSPIARSSFSLGSTILAKEGAAAPEGRGGQLVLKNGTIIVAAIEEATLDGAPVTFAFVSDTAIIRTREEFDAALRSEPLASGGTLRVKLAYRSDGLTASGSNATCLISSADGNSIQPLGSFKGAHDSSTVVELSVSAGARLGLKISVPDDTVREYLIERMFFDKSDLAKSAENAEPAPETEKPRRFELFEAFPNPFNPTTTIRYSVPRQVYVSLIVYNTLGEQVAILETGAKEEGEHEIQFDASSLASGVYLYRLHAGDFLQTKKIVLVH